MTNKEMILVENVQENGFVSDLLKGLEQALRSETKSLEVKRKIQPNAKGEIIIGIAIGLATNFIYDALKAVIRVYKGHENYDSDTIIKIDGKEYSLKEIEKK